MSNKLFDKESHKRLAMQALLVLGLVTFVGGSVVFFYQASLPYVGFEFSGESVVGAVAPDGPAAAAGLQVGDRILTIDGLSPMSSGEIYLRPGEGTLQLEVAREGQTLFLAVNPAPPSLATVLDKAGYFLMALGFWIIAILVLVFKPRDSVAQFFVLLTLLGTAVVVIWRMADLGALWANLLMGVLAAAIGPMFVHYHTLFPERSHFRGKGLLLGCLYGIGAVLAVLSLSLDVLYYTGLYRHFGSDPWPSAAVTIKAYFSVCLVAGLVLLGRTYRVTTSERSKRQIALVALGSTLALLPLIVLILVPQILFAHYLIPSWIPLLMLAFIPASYLYATYRHDLMKLDRVVNRSVALFFLGLALVLLYLGLEWGIRSLVPDSRPLPVTLGDIIPVLVLLFAFQPLKRQIERGVDHLFYGGWYNYESFTLEMSRALNEAVDLETIVTLLTENVAQTMRVKEIALLLPDGEDAFCVRASRGFEPTIPDCPAGVLVNSLQESGKPIEHELLGKRLRSELDVRGEIAGYTQAGVQMWVPLVQQGELEAILVLGNKVADEFYTRNDHTILFTLAQQAAIALARARLVEELKGRLGEVQALSQQLLALQERNQQRMALELHDQAVQDLLFVRQLLDSALREAAPAKRIEGARDELLRIAGYLDTLIFELRPPELERGELGQILNKYAVNFQKRRDVPVAFQAHGSSGGAAIPEEIKLAVYRIFQESLNNARKHAEAQQVEAILDVRPDCVRLEVRDDGVGFEVPAHLGGWIHANRLGLLGMRARAKELGGDLKVMSQPGHGTGIVVSVPLPPA
jgi:signal transduction histidine kinase